MNINFEEEVTEYRIDEIERWVNAKVIEVDCQMILKFWNIVDDISESVKNQFIKGQIFQRGFMKNFLWE